MQGSRLARVFVALAVGLGLILAGRSISRHASRRAPAAGEREVEPAEENGAGTYPSDWFAVQRAFPGTTIPQEKFRAAFLQTMMERALQERVIQGLGASVATALAWLQAGPFNIGGRVTGLAVAPGGNTVYLGAANGGIFKSVNGGVNWVPVFDSLGVFSIGALALEPGNSNVVYAGTGEANSAADTYDGAGLFRSTDAGRTWQYIGLEATRRIARVAIDPADPNRIFVAAMGTQFSTGPERGLYRSEDRGATWNKVLFANDSTGACDVVINPVHSDTVYCATWERIRRPSYRRAFGPGCGIWRSADHGTTWTRLATGLPAPADNVGRIALGIAASRPAVLYAQIITGASGGYAGLGMFRSMDGGATWTRRDVSGFTNMFGGFGWYFGDMAVDPTIPDKVYALGVPLRRSTDGGAHFSDITGSAHVDQHALWIDPTNPSRLYLGSDGGFFRSTNGGGTWLKSVDLPITQFYAGAIDPADPNRLLGGTQDNNTLLTAGSSGGWIGILGGDGFQCLVDPTNPDILFAEYQNCSSGTGPQRSADGGGSFAAPSGFAPGDRYNWNSPFVMDPRDHDVLLAGSQRVYRSVDNGVSYVPISPDLSTNPPASLVYGTLTTLDISGVSGTYYAGTDDGKVWRSADSGASWVDISAGLPVRWVTRVTADLFDGGTVYVTLSGFGRDEVLAHVYRSTDRGAHWTSIAGNLPDAPANDIVMDPADPYTLYLATDLGVYATRNGGASWFPLGLGMPVQTIFDLSLHVASRTLVAATHGRGQWKLDLAGLPTEATARPPAARLVLSAPSPNPSRGTARLTLEVPAGAGTAQGSGGPAAISKTGGEAAESKIQVEVAVFDAAGRRVCTLQRGAYGPGRHDILWDGRDERGVRASAGVYFVRAVAGGAVQVRRLVRVP